MTTPKESRNEILEIAKTSGFEQRLRWETRGYLSRIGVEDAHGIEEDGLVGECLNTLYLSKFKGRYPFNHGESVIEGLQRIPPSRLVQECASGPRASSAARRTFDLDPLDLSATGAPIDLALELSDDLRKGAKRLNRTQKGLLARSLGQKSGLPSLVRDCLGVDSGDENEATGRYGTAASCSQALSIALRRFREALVIGLSFLPFHSNAEAGMEPWVVRGTCVAKVRGMASLSTSVRGMDESLGVRGMEVAEMVRGTIESWSVRGMGELESVRGTV